MMQLAGWFGRMAEDVAEGFQERLVAGTATTTDVQETDRALEVFENEVAGISLKASNSQERMDAEQLWSRIRNYRENLGLPSRDALFALLENSSFH